MRYALPISASNELAPLRRAGASEFYCGYQNAAWSAEYGSHDSLTRRQGAANIQTEHELKTVVSVSQKLHTPVWLAMNGRYSSEQLDRVLVVCDSWSRWGGSGIILREPTLLRTLAEQKDPPRLAVSLLAACLNRKAVEFWVRLGAKRIILPRMLHLSEISSITKAFPDCEFEAMVMADRCLFIDGFCRCIHGNTYQRRTEFVDHAPQISTFDISGKAHHLCLDCYASKSGGCAACYLEELEEAGVAVGKFGGRGTPLDYRLSMLSFLQTAKSLKTAEERASLHQELLGECQCYYGCGEA